MIYHNIYITARHNKNFLYGIQNLQIMSNIKTMNKGEIQVVLGLLVFNGRATTEQLANNFALSERYIRNITVMLRKKKIISSLRAKDIKTGIRFGSPLFNSSIEELPDDNKQKVHILTMDFPSLMKRYPEILEWTDVILKINKPEELEDHLKKLRRDKHAKKKKE